MKKLLLITLLTSTLLTSLYGGGGGDILRSSFVADKLEMQISQERAMAWDIYAYSGYDKNKIYFFTEGSRQTQDFSPRTPPEDFTTEYSAELLYSRAISPYWDFQIGGAIKRSQEDSQNLGVVALSGLAPYFFETRLKVFFDDNGSIEVNFSAEYEALITQKLILSPSFELSGSSKDNLNMGVAKGLTNITLGLRLRYEVQREFAPYVGLEQSNNLGGTNDLENLNETSLTLGVRFWF